VETVNFWLSVNPSQKVTALKSEKDCSFYSHKRKTTF